MDILKQIGLFFIYFLAGCALARTGFASTCVDKLTRQVEHSENLGGFSTVTVNRLFFANNLEWTFEPSKISKLRGRLENKDHLALEYVGHRTRYKKMYFVLLPDSNLKESHTELVLIEFVELSAGETVARIVAHWKTVFPKTVEMKFYEKIADQYGIKDLTLKFTSGFFAGHELALPKRIIAKLAVKHKVSVNDVDQAFSRCLVAPTFLGELPLNDLSLRHYSFVVKTVENTYIRVIFARKKDHSHVLISAYYVPLGKWRRFGETPRDLEDWF